MSRSNSPRGVSAAVQPWQPGAPAGGVTCPACGLANEPGARTCRNCGLPIARSDDPVRGVAPGHVDLPEVRRSGISAMVGFVLVIALLMVGGSLAVSGGGGLLSGGGRFLEAAATPTPTPAPQVATGPDGTDTTGEDTSGDEAVNVAASGTNFDYTCEAGAIRDLSKGKWFLSDVQAGLRTAEDGSLYDQVYWKLSRTTDRSVQNPTKVTMQWTTPDAAKERFGDAIGRVQGDRAVLVSFNGPVDIAVNAIVEREQLDGEGIDQVRRVQLFEHKGKVRTIIGLNEDSCARMRSTGWAKNSKRDNARVVLDLERVYEAR